MVSVVSSCRTYAHERIVGVFYHVKCKAEFDDTDMYSIFTNQSNSVLLQINSALVVLIDNFIVYFVALCLQEIPGPYHLIRTSSTTTSSASVKFFVLSF